MANIDHKLLDVQIGTAAILYDMSIGIQRPVLPKSWIRLLFNPIRGLSHSDARPTQREMYQRFVWHNMKRAIRQRC